MAENGEKNMALVTSPSGYWAMQLFYYISVCRRPKPVIGKADHRIRKWLYGEMDKVAERMRSFNSLRRARRALCARIVGPDVLIRCQNTLHCRCDGDGDEGSTNDNTPTSKKVRIHKREKERQNNRITNQRFSHDGRRPEEASVRPSIRSRRGSWIGRHYTSPINMPTNRARLVISFGNKYNFIIRNYY